MKPLQKQKYNLNIVASYLPKVNNKTTKARREISPKSTIKTQKKHQWHCYCVFNGNPKHTTQLAPAPLLQLWIGKCQMLLSSYYPNNHHLTYPHNSNGFHFPNNIVHNHCGYKCKNRNNHKNNNNLLKTKHKNVKIP